MNASLRRTTTVPCGRCVPCLERKRNDWSLRLSEEMRHCTTAVFLTLTYNDESLPYSEDSGLPTLVKSHLQLFLKQLRNYLKQGIQTTNHFGKSVKTPKSDVKLIYFAQGEYGTNKDRPHYHMILFNFPSNCQFLIEKAWYHGFVHFGECNNATIHYTTKYMITKYDSDFDFVQKPFALMSKGIGKNYVERNGEWHKKNLVPTITKVGGSKYPLPRYFKDKIFNPDEKMKISAKNISYSERRNQKLDNELMESVKDSSEFFQTKNERVISYLGSREKFLNKSKKL